MSASRLPILNAVSNAAALVAFIAVQFFLTPVTLDALGDERYGVWSLVESFIAYMMLFDLGVAASLVRFVPKLLATDDRAGLTRVFSACLSFFLGAAVVSLLVGALFLVVGLEWVLEVPPRMRDEVRWLFLALVGNFALSLPISVFPAVLDGLQAFVAKSATRTACLVLRVPLVLLAVRSASPLLGLAAAVTACNLIEGMILTLLVFRKLPDLRFAPRSVDRTTFQMIRGYSVNSFLAMIAGRLAFQTDAFVIGAWLPVGAITVFAIPSRLVETAKSVMRAVTTTLTPAVSALEARDDRAAIRAVFLQGTRLTQYLALPIQVGLFLLGPPFLARWIGAGHARVATPTLFILASVLSLTVAQSMAARVLYGMGRIHLFARMALLEGAANLMLSVGLIGWMGVEGVALGTAIPHAAFCLFAIVHVCRLLKTAAGTYLGQALLRPILAAGLLTAIWAWRVQASPPAGYDQLIVTGLCGMVPYAILVALFEAGPRVTLPAKILRAFARAAGSLA